MFVVGAAELHLLDCPLVRAALIPSPSVGLGQTVEKWGSAEGGRYGECTQKVTPNLPSD